MLEAMAVGTPVVAADVHGINEQIEDEESGLLFDAGKPGQLAERIIEVLRNPRSARARAVQAKRRVQKQFEARRMALQHRDLYRRVSEKKKRQQARRT